MDDEREMGPRFARLQAFLGAWTLGGISILMFLGASPVLGVVTAFVGLVILMVAVTGMPERKRPYSQIEWVALFLHHPRYGPVRQGNGILIGADMEAIAEQIKRVCDKADYLRSLDVDGKTDLSPENNGPKAGLPG